MKIYLARHGETEWTITGQHTGLSDIPLTAHGEEQARELAPRLAGIQVARVLVSPLQRARRTCDLAGFGARAEVEPGIREWGYGNYEGRTTLQIREERPGWDLFRDGCPGGESIADVAARADGVSARLRSAGQDVLLISHGHFLRIFAVRLLGLAPETARQFLLDTGAVSVVGWNVHDETPELMLWNARGGE